MILGHFLLLFALDRLGAPKKNNKKIIFFLQKSYTASYLNLLRTPFLESRLVNPGEMTHKKTIALTGDNCFCPTRTSSGRQLKSLRCSCPVPALALSLPLTPVTSGVTSLSLWRAFGGCDGDSCCLARCVYLGS